MRKSWPSIFDFFAMAWLADKSELWQAVTISSEISSNVLVCLRRRRERGESEEVGGIRITL